MTFAYTVAETFIAWWALVAVVIWIWLVLTSWVEKIRQRINPPETSAEILVQQMFAENVTVSRDPTIPTGEYNPKHIARREIGGKR